MKGNEIRDIAVGTSPSGPWLTIGYTDGGCDQMTYDRALRKAEDDDARTKIISAVDASDAYRG